MVVQTSMFGDATFLNPGVWDGWVGGWVGVCVTNFDLWSYSAGREGSQLFSGKTEYKKPACLFPLPKQISKSNQSLLQNQPFPKNQNNENNASDSNSLKPGIKLLCLSNGCIGLQADSC